MSDEQAEEAPAFVDGGAPQTLDGRRTALQVGRYAWALVGIALATLIVGLVLSRLLLVIVPLVLALLPAALLAPLATALKRRGWPPALAAFVPLIGGLLLLGGIIAALVPSVAAQSDEMVEGVRAGIQDLDRFLADGPFGLEPTSIGELYDRARERLQSGDILGGVLGALAVAAEGLAGLLFGLVVLFFYLKDGSRIAAWVRDLFPVGVRNDVEEIGNRAWDTISGYIRGQLLIAFVDALIIGVAMVVLRVPVALALSVVIFLGALFPIVGAVVSGALAVLVALAVNGPVVALILLGVIVVVQQVEGDVLAPVVLGRAVQLHPLATLVALTAGAVLFGILGALLAVPIAASASRAASYLRSRVDPLSAGVLPTARGRATG